MYWLDIDVPSILFQTNIMKHDYAIEWILWLFKTRKYGELL